MEKDRQLPERYGRVLHGLRSGPAGDHHDEAHDLRPGGAPAPPGLIALLLAAGQHTGVALLRVEVLRGDRIVRGSGR